MLRPQISCYYSTCTIPDPYKGIFEESEEVLTSSEGWDPGAMNLAQAIAMKHRVATVSGEVSRLLLDLDRDDESCWSEYAMKLTVEQMQKLVDRYGTPFLQNLQRQIESELQKGGQVLHFRIHTHAEGGEVIRLGWNPRQGERLKALVKRMQEVLEQRGIRVAVEEEPEIAGLTRVLQDVFDSERYLSVRISAAQSCFLESKPMKWDLVKKAVVEAIGQVLAEENAES